jgi:granule-bound starch synthase
MGVPQKYIDSITFNMAVKIGKKNVKVSTVNTMAAGLKYADRVMTVSPTYAMECSNDPERGVELEALFKLGRATGVLNGVKEGVSPSNPIFVEKVGLTCGPFTAETADAAKAELKASYRAISGLSDMDGPLMVFIGRLDVQKGYDILLEALADVLEDTEMQVVIVGAGRKDLVEMTKAMQKKFPTKFHYAGWMGPERYALLAGSDFTLLPSRWEPCGLVQMEAMRMGTLPIIAPTGGLKDTVEDDVTGFWSDSEMTMEAELDDKSISSLSSVLRRAAKAHTSEPKKISEMRKAAMAAASEFSWTNAALQYEIVFEELGAVDVLSQTGTEYVTLETDKQVC